MPRQLDTRREMRDGSRLKEIASGRGGEQRPAAGSGEPSPKSAYEAVTREMVHSLRGEVRDVKTRINQLITLIIAAIVLEVLMRLIGVSG